MYLKEIKTGVFFTISLLILSFGSVRGQSGYKIDLPMSFKSDSLLGIEWFNKARKFAYNQSYDSAWSAFDISANLFKKHSRYQMYFGIKYELCQALYLANQQSTYLMQASFLKAEAERLLPKGDPMVFAFASMIGLFYQDLERYEEALKQYENIEKGMKLENVHPRYFASLYNNLTICYIKTHKDSLALQSAETALKLFSTYYSQNKTVLPSLYSHLSTIYEQMGDLSKSLYNCEYAFDLHYKYVSDRGIADYLLLMKRYSLLLHFSRREEGEKLLSKYLNTYFTTNALKNNDLLHALKRLVKSEDPLLIEYAGKYYEQYVTQDRFLKAQQKPYQALILLDYVSLLSSNKNTLDKADTLLQKIDEIKFLVPNNTTLFNYLATEYYYNRWFVDSKLSPTKAESSSKEFMKYMEYIQKENAIELSNKTTHSRFDQLIQWSLSKK